VRAGHQGGHFFVPHLDELNFFLDAFESPGYAVNAVALVGPILEPEV